MRLIPKYKIYYKSKLLSYKFPLRIIKLLRPKWKVRYKKDLIRLGSKPYSYLKSKINPHWKFKTGYYNSIGTERLILQKWNKLSLSYKNKVLVKNTLYNIFDSSIRQRFFKNKILNKTKKDILSLFSNILILPHFRIDVLLYSVNVFSTIFQARQFIKGGIVVVNGKKVRCNYIIKKHDVISFSSNLDKFNPLFSEILLKNKSIFNNTQTSNKELIFHTLRQKNLNKKLILNNILFKHIKVSYLYKKKINNSLLKNFSFKKVILYNLLKKSYLINHKLKLRFFSSFFKYNSDIYSLNRFFSSFLEIDPYTKTIIVLKNYNELQKQHFLTLNLPYFNTSILKKIIDYYKK